MIYEIEVRPTQEIIRSGQYFTPYIETVEASTSGDAISRVKRRNPGCLVTCTRSYNKPRNTRSSSTDNDTGGKLIFLVIAGIVMLVVEGIKIVIGWVMNFWQWITGIFGVIWQWIVEIWNWITFSPLHFIGTLIGIPVSIFIFLIILGLFVGDD